MNKDKAQELLLKTKSLQEKSDYWEKEKEKVSHDFKSYKLLTTGLLLGVIGGLWSSFLHKYISNYLDFNLYFLVLLIISVIASWIFLNELKKNIRPKLNQIVSGVKRTKKDLNILEKELKESTKK